MIFHFASCSGVWRTSERGSPHFQPAEISIIIRASSSLSSMTATLRANHQPCQNGLVLKAHSGGESKFVDLGCVVHESSLGHSSVNTDRPLPIARRSSAVHRTAPEHPAGVPENSSLASESVIPRSARAMSQTISVK